MARYIDADAFEDYVFDKWTINEISNSDWITFREWLKDQESVIEFEGDITKVVVRGEEYIKKSADVRENVRGEWVQIAPDIDDVMMCSSCKALNSYQMRDAAELCFFCPNCGADMRSKNEQQA